MGKTLEDYDFGLKDANVKNKKSNEIIKTKKCNQCDYESSHTGHMRTHLKMHSGEKSNKCNQCDYSSSETDNLKIHLEMHKEFKSILDRITCSD